MVRFVLSNNRRVSPWVMTRQLTQALNTLTAAQPEVLPMVVFPPEGGAARPG